jgi:lysophospholipase L1-like esterase
MSPPQLDAWRWLRRALSELKPADAITLDAAALLGATMDSELTGTYLPDLSDDGAHPNDVGHSLIADRLVSLLRSSCGAAAFT